MKHEVTAKRLQKALEQANITQQELADKSKVNKASISQYINGSHKPSNISSGKMAEILDVNPMWLMGYDVPMDTAMQHKAKQDAKFLDFVSDWIKSSDVNYEELISNNIEEYFVYPLREKYGILFEFAEKMRNLTEEQQAGIFNMIDLMAKKEGKE